MRGEGRRGERSRGGFCAIPRGRHHPRQVLALLSPHWAGLAEVYSLSLTHFGEAEGSGISK